jgi:hypothetical protein
MSEFGGRASSVPGPPHEKGPRFPEALILPITLSIAVDCGDLQALADNVRE